MLDQCEQHAPELLIASAGALQMKKVLSNEGTALVL